MKYPFFVSEHRLDTLSATRQGRISLSGFCYQASFAIARMAAMITRRECSGLKGVPELLRYDWGEDLDERCAGSTVCFYQCKKVDDIGQPASLADILVGFAPKLLWAATEDRGSVRLCLVCTDKRFSSTGSLAQTIPNSRDATRKHFVESLSNSPNARADRAEWQDEADEFGHCQLFDTLWSQTTAIFLSDSVHEDHPAGPSLEGERDALRLLLEFRAIDANRQRDAVGRLRSVLHENVIEFDPTSDRSLDFAGRTPRLMHRQDVVPELFEFRHHDRERLPFQVVSQAFLQEQREKPKRQFVARPPEWSDVVHGMDETVKYLERDQTQELRQAVVDDLIEPVRRGTDQRLPVKFVLGPPGSGKSTIARRVVAMLVEEGHIVVADPGVYVGNPSDIGRFCQKVDELGSDGKPVLVLLDDPLYANSDWPAILTRLAAPGGQVSALVASPTFLYERYRSFLRGRLKRTEFHIAAPSDGERLNLGRLYGTTSPQSDETEDDFLVLSMQQAVGVSFDEIIDRLWETLNDGQPIDPESPFESYCWPGRVGVFRVELQPCA